MRKVAIITARGGSKRIPRKNCRNFLGKPIIAYSIETAFSSELFDEIMVSTDDAEIADIAKNYGAKVPFLRSEEKSDDFSGADDAVVEVLKEYAARNISFDYACCIFPTAPFITKKSLREAFEVLIANNYGSVFPVVRFSYPIQRALRVSENASAKMFQPENYHARSQDLEPAYHDAGQFYWLNAEIFLKDKLLWAEKNGVVVLSEQEVQDIDNTKDWEMAEFKYQWLREKQNS